MPPFDNHQPCSFPTADHKSITSQNCDKLMDGTDAAYVLGSSTPVADVRVDINLPAEELHEVSYLLIKNNCREVNQCITLPSR